MRDAYVYSYPSPFSIYPAIRRAVRSPLIKVSLYFIIPLPLHFLNKKRLSNRIASYTSIFRNIV
ncbi:hypothetical protein DN392_29045 [Bacillus sp. BB51/4]|nr:hypothetical protein DN392_29045 [Bacillus sp. BB51/4]TCD29903.1 hypothetical protein E0D84_25275 [Bacillus wiedmannii]